MSRAAPPSSSPFTPAPARSSPAGSAGAAEIGGYRLVRRLGQNEEVVTWLARGGEESVVLRVFRETASDARIDAELLARERLRGPHVPALLDLATGPHDRPVAVLAAVVGPSLRDVLARTEQPLRAGHVTTILAPLAALLDGAHELGATLGRLDAGAVRLDAAGAPVVVSLGRAAAAAPLPERFRHREPAIVDDRRALDALAAELVERVDPHERESVRDAVGGAIGDPARLELAVFDCAAPLPLTALIAAPARPDVPPDAVPMHHRGPVASGVLRSGGLPPLPRVSRSDDSIVEGPDARGAVRALGDRLGLPSGLLAPVDAMAASARARVAAFRTAFRARGAVRERPRRAVVIAGVAGALALAAAVALASLESAPASGDAATDTVDEPPRDLSAGPGPSAESHPAGVDAAGPSSAPSSEDASALPDVASDPAPEQWAPLVGALVDRWLTCSAAPDPECASAAVHAGSAAEESLLAGGSTDTGHGLVLSEWAAGAREAVVVDRQGAAAVIDLVSAETTTASLLVLRSEAGWRLRSVLPSG